MSEAQRWVAYGSNGSRVAIEVRACRVEWGDGWQAWWAAFDDMHASDVRTTPEHALQSALVELMGEYDGALVEVLREGEATRAELLAAPERAYEACAAECDHVVEMSRGLRDRYKPGSPRYEYHDGERAAAVLLASRVRVRATDAALAVLPPGGA